MHILHVETGRHLYGGPRQVLDLMRGLRRRGVSGTLACAEGSAIAAAAAADGLDVAGRALGGDLDLSCVFWLNTLVRERRPDLLHAHSRRGADFFGGIAARIAGVPAVLTRRVDNADTPLVGALKYRAYDAIVAISAGVRRVLLASGVPAGRVSVIRSAVDAAACQPTWPREKFLREFELAGNVPVVVAVAQLIPRKGIGLLLEAWPRIRAGCPGARLLIFGSGPLGESLRHDAAPADDIRFAGFHPQLREFLGRADLLVHPALQEGLGVGLLEAQAAGVPVVAFAAGGVPEVIKDGVTGLLLPPGDAGALADATIALLNDSPRRQQFGQEARRRAGTLFGVEPMVDAYLALYRKVCGVAA